MAYRTTAIETDRMPPGIPWIIGNEAAERFSFYGMRTILVAFMASDRAAYINAQTVLMDGGI